ncbi:cytochrome P450 [archaeon]|nr:MAG: cytochrome P450 [archaeon]
MILELGISALITFAGWLVYATYFFLDQRLRMWKFRGPMAFPVIGNAYDPAAVYFLRYLSTMRKKFGKIYTLFSFFSGFLVVCDPKVVRRILSDSKTFYKGTDYTMRFDIAFGEGLVTANGEKHRRDRTVFGKYFIRASIAKFAGTINKVSRACIDQYLTPLIKNGQSVSIDIEDFFAKLTLRNFMNFSLSTDLSHDLERERMVCDLVSKGSHAMGTIIVFALPLWSILPQVKTVKYMRDAMIQLFRDVLAQRRDRLSRGLDGDVDDCLSAMLQDNMPENEMVDHFVTLVCAGHDTTAFFLSYTTYLLATHPEVQDKLYAAVMKQVGHKDEVTVDDFGELKYLHCIMMETLRYYAIIPAVTRVASEDVYIKEANVTIPKGVSLLCPMIVLNRDPEIWDKPSEFIPERFVEKGNDFTSAKDGFFPFGYGTRTCIGNLFAQVEAGITLCMMLKQFRFEAEPEFRPLIRAGISLTTSNGVKIVLKAR